MVQTLKCDGELIVDGYVNNIEKRLCLKLNEIPSLMNNNNEALISNKTLHFFKKVQYK